LGDGDEAEDEDEEQGEITPSPHSPMLEDLPSLGDLFRQQAGISIGARRSEHPQTGIDASFGPPLQSRLTLVFLIYMG
jgi:hypothetical protein